MKTRLGIVMVLTIALVACTAGSAEWTPLASGAEPPATCARADVDGAIALSADQVRFSAPCMAVTVQLSFVVRFKNKESEPHDVAIYTDRSKATAVIVGDAIIGPNKTVDYPVAGLAAGDYYFVCTIHPAAMNGALYVR